MQFHKKNVSNPMLVGTMELLKAEPTPEHNQMFVGEMMKAEYLTSVILTPMPEPDADGVIRPEKNTKLQLPMLSAPDGRNFFAVYTDRWEFEKRAGADNANQTAAVVTFEEIMMMTLRRDSVSSGAVINPSGANLVISKEMMAGIMGAKLARMKEKEQNPKE